MKWKVRYVFALSGIAGIRMVLMDKLIALCYLSRCSQTFKIKGKQSSNMIFEVEG